MHIRTIPTIENPVISLPENLSALRELASNFRWTWDPQSDAIFRTIDAESMRAGTHPYMLLQQYDRLQELAGDDHFVEQVQGAAERLRGYLDSTDVWANRQGNAVPGTIAYFCAEYGLTESFPQYSGGLGILAGDHCKEASDMGLPMVAMGCFYQLGFFRQVLDSQGRQEHCYPSYNPERFGLKRIADPATGEPLRIHLPLPGRTLAVGAWLAPVGRLPLLLLDTNLPENQPEDRVITSQLYMRSRSMRFYQELVLGVVGVRVLRALGIQPSVYHMNEGHSALLLVELLGERVAGGATMAGAVSQVKQECVLTIHTPVPAGNERFDSKLVKAVLGPLAEEKGLTMPSLLKLAKGEDGDARVFDMTAFALRMSRAANGVSLLHGCTADSTWRQVVHMPIQGVTNGVHMPTWLGPEMKRLYAQAGAHFENETSLELSYHSRGNATWEGVSRLSDEDVWHAHNDQKRALVALANHRLLMQRLRAGDGPDELREVRHALNPEAFIIGFARRFATYKRASLLFRDPKRLSAILSNPKAPVQIVFAGKAHPADTEGQAMIGEIYHYCQLPVFRGKVFLLEDYDMAVGRAMVQGVDLWMNNPLRPLEASGTSGMKAAANGVPNASILDGWWDEGFDESGQRNGFAIGSRQPRRTRAAQDKFDATEIYRVLEDEVLPLYWDRDDRNLPKEWIQVMRRSIATSVYTFSTLRMLEDYVDMIYRSKR